MNPRLPTYIVALLVLLNGLSIPVLAIHFTTSSGDLDSAISTSGDYKLSDKASLRAMTTLGDGYVYQERNAGGSGNNQLKESVSGSQYSIENTVDSSGQMSSSSTTIASSEIGAVSTDTDLCGQFGSIGTIANSRKNLVMVEGGYSGEGDLKANLKSFASDSAMTTGTASMLGMQCFSDDISGMMASGSTAIGVNAIYLTSDENIGEFQMTALNLEKPAKSPSPTKPGGGAPTDPDLREYSLTNWMLGGAIPITIAQNDDNGAIMPAGANAEIVTATNTWETAYGDSTKFFSTVALDPNAKVRDVPSGYNGGYNLYDGKNMHGWSNDPQIFTQSNIIAVTWTRRDPNTILQGADGKPYYAMAESDCYYNGKLTWYISDGTNDANTKVDIQTIALHELGHTIGLADLYSKATSDEVMYGYYSGVRKTPHTGDKAGLLAKYGTPTPSTTL